MDSRISLALIATLAAAVNANAQTLTPCYVTDSTDDAVYRLSDVNADGDFNDAGEITVFYDDVTGSQPLQVNIGIVSGPAGIYYLCDSGEDKIFTLQDMNSDDDALDAGEISTYFDGTGASASGVIMSSAQDLCWDPSTGVIWIANAGASGADDSIIRLEDLTADGDANDVGEAIEFYVPAPGAGAGVSVPQHVTVGPAGGIYYIEAGGAGSLLKGVYRLDDLDLSGTIDQPNEVINFYTPANLQLGFPTHLMYATDGYWYMSDQLSDNIRRFRDVNMDGTIQDGVEDSIWYGNGASLIWEFNQAPDGSSYAIESQTPDRLLRLEDLDASGAIDQPGEVIEIYDETLAAIAIGNPRGFAIEGGPPTPTFTDLCSGDGGDQLGCTNCPCGNNATPGTIGGCLNSAATSVRISASGSTSTTLPASITTDLRFGLTGAPPLAFCILQSGDAVAPQGMGNPCFGLNSGVQSSVFDGLRCAIMNTQRHGGRSADGNGDIGLTNNPWGGEGPPAIGIAAAAPFVAGQTRYFQVVNRDDPLAVCGRGLNTSQAVEVTFN